MSCFDTGREILCLGIKNNCVTCGRTLTFCRESARCQLLKIPSLIDPLVCYSSGADRTNLLQASIEYYFRNTRYLGTQTRKGLKN